mmetsp:Transcript_26469/g.78318  ORF Transcript_26469/g.78318 Transcript_26469/m.78318 type:complete len:200 (+) Transcript_26469:1219-1818(+)
MTTASNFPANLAASASSSSSPSSFAAAEAAAAARSSSVRTVSTKSPHSTSMLCVPPLPFRLSLSAKTFSAYFPAFSIIPGDRSTPLTRRISTPSFSSAASRRNGHNAPVPQATSNRSNSVLGSSNSTEPSSNEELSPSLAAADLALSSLRAFLVVRPPSAASTIDPTIEDARYFMTGTTSGGVASSDEKKDDMESNTSR